MIYYRTIIKIIIKYIIPDHYVVLHSGGIQGQVTAYRLEETVRIYKKIVDSSVAIIA